MIHIFRESTTSHRILVLLHGTGADELDLIPLATNLDPDASVLSLRGNVSENGMLRFFKRISPNVFDQKSILLEAQGINTFITDMVHMHNSTVDNLVFVGFSNGANMIAAMLHLYPETVKNAMILHGLQPLEAVPKIDLSNAKVFVSTGTNDKMIESSASLSLVSTLRARSADVTVFKNDSAHTIQNDEIAAAKEFLKKIEIKEN
jgi:phospholipase/carboxylesterase